jgi:hypothetical protein
LSLQDLQQIDVLAMRMAEALRQLGTLVAASSILARDALQAVDLAAEAPSSVTSSRYHPAPPTRASPRTPPQRAGAPGTACNMSEAAKASTAQELARSAARDICIRARRMARVHGLAFSEFGAAVLVLVCCCAGRRHAAMQRCRLVRGG